MTIFVGFVLFIGVIALAFAGLLFSAAMGMMGEANKRLDDATKAELAAKTVLMYNQEMATVKGQKLLQQRKYVEAVSQEINDRMMGRDWSMEELQDDPDDDFPVA